MTRPSGDDLPLSRIPPVDEDVRREVEFHLDERVAELIRRGLTPEQARAVARASFGDRAAVEAECREIEQRRRSTRRRASYLSELWQDLQLGARTLRKNPGFALSAILPLALGIGAHAAVFSIVNGVILQPLPYEQADRLVTVLERHEKGGVARMPWPNFVDLEAQSHTFDGLGAYGTGLATVIVDGSARRVNATAFSTGFFKTFPLKPVLGRLPTDDDGRSGANPVAVVSYAFWRDALGAPASLDTVHITVDRPVSVVGVLPRGFDFPDASQIWLPIEPRDAGTSRTGHNWQVIGRLRGGVAAADAQHDLDGVLARLKPLYLADFDAAGAQVTPLQAAMTGRLRTPLYLLLAASAVLLLGACVNLASATLARGTARSAEFAVRSAIGATRVRLIRQLLTESALLAFLGCAAGLAFAAALLKILAYFAPSSLHVERVHIDAWVEGFALVVAGATAVIFGLFPAIRLSGSSSAAALRDGSRGTAGAKRMRAWNVLVGFEVALAVVLLSASALLIRSFGRVMETRLGFDTANVYTIEIDLPRVNYADLGPPIAAFHDRLLERLSHVTGVQSVGFATVLPLAGSLPDGGMIVEGKPLSSRQHVNGMAEYCVVGGDFFAAMGIPVTAGHAFQMRDRNDAGSAVVVNEEYAKREWPGQDPIGKRVKVSGMDRNDVDDGWFTVIGVVGNVRGQTVTGPYAETYYFDQHTRPAFRTRQVTYVMKSTLPLTVIAPMIRREIAAIDREVPAEISTMNDLVTRSVADRRFTMLMLGAFATVALLLAVVGIYAVVSYTVAQRTREIGVRLALGATPAGVRTLVLASAMHAVVPGLAVGALLALGASQALRAFLYGVTPFDGIALAGAVGTLGVAAAISSLLPAARATRVDPIIAMRAE